MVIPNQIDYIDTQRSVLSDRTDAYVNENGRMVKIEYGYFYKRFCREQIEYYLNELAKCEKDICRDCNRR